MFKKLVATGIFAGLGAGLIAAALQIFFIVPILLEAERYESGELVHFGTGAEIHAGGGAQDSGALASATAKAVAHDTATDDHGSAASNLMRDATTVLATVATYCGFGLLMVAGFAVAGQRGYHPDGRSGLLWGVCGFIAVQLAPAAGLPPELPGSSAGDLVLRQVWWFSAVLLTGAGLWIIAFARHWVPWALGAALIVLPQLFAAPHPEIYQGVAPPELASSFAARSLAAGLASWSILGLLAGYIWHRNPVTGDP